jgi:hypothetical protein
LKQERKADMGMSKNNTEWKRMGKWIGFDFMGAIIIIIKMNEANRQAGCPQRFKIDSD